LIDQIGRKRDLISGIDGDEGEFEEKLNREKELCLQEKVDKEEEISILKTRKVELQTKLTTL